MDRSSQLTQSVKSLPAMWETQIRSLGWEDPLEKGMVTQSRILAWRIPMDRETWWAAVHGVTKSRTWLSDFHCQGKRIPGTEEPGGLQSTWLQRVRHDWAAKTFTLSHGVTPVGKDILIYSSVLCICFFKILRRPFMWNTIRMKLKEGKNNLILLLLSFLRPSASSGLSVNEDVECQLD